MYPQPVDARTNPDSQTIIAVTTVSSCFMVNSDGLTVGPYEHVLVSADDKVVNGYFESGHLKKLVQLLHPDDFSSLFVDTNANVSVAGADLPVEKQPKTKNKNSSKSTSDIQAVAAEAIGEIVAVVEEMLDTVEEIVEQQPENQSENL